METEIPGILLGAVLPIYPLLFVIHQKIGRFEIPPYREMRDMTGRRVYPRAPGTHTVRIRTARQKIGLRGKKRDFSPANGGYLSPVFELTIAADVNDEWE